MSKLAWGVLAFALLGIGAFLAFVLGAQEVGAGIALLGLFAFAPAGIAGYGADAGD
jgi:hypothetical protein